MWILCFISPVAPVLKSPRRFLPGSRLTQVMLLQGMVATAAWRQTSRLVRTVGRSLMLSPLAFRNRMTVKITPPPVRCFHWPSWWSRHWFEWREKGIVYGYPEKAPLCGLYPAKKSRLMFLLQEEVVQLERLMGGYCMQIPATQWQNAKPFSHRRHVTHIHIPINTVSKIYIFMCTNHPPHTSPHWLHQIHLRILLKHLLHPFLYMIFA